MTNFESDPPARPIDGPSEAGDWTIALDGGTTNTRARLLHGSRLVATARRAVGVRDTVLDGPRPGAAAHAGGPARPVNRAGLARAVREVVDEVRGQMEREIRTDRGTVSADVRPEIVAAGMLSSEVGLAAVPHVLAPAGLEDLARAAQVVTVPEVREGPILVVPGVRTPATGGPYGWFESDVMRGEECETLGAYFELLADGRIARGAGSLFLWPGSHTKLVAVDGENRIARSFTTLGGEILQAVAQHTLLAASLPAALPDDLDRDAVVRGAHAARCHGLGRAAFLVRIAALGETLDERGRASFWIGAAVEADVISLAGHPLLEPGRSIWVGGREPLRSLYASGLSGRHAGPVIALDDALAEAASAFGAATVAARRRILDAAGQG